MDDNNVSKEIIGNEEITEVVTRKVKVRRLKIGPLIAIIFLVLIVTGITSILFAYNRFVNDPVKIFTKAINLIYENFHDELKNIQETEDTYFNIEEESLRVDADVSLDGTYMNFNQLKDNLFKISMGMDYKNDLVTMSAGIEENKEDLIDGTFYFNEKKAYIESNSLFNNIYSTSIDENIFADVNIKDLQDELNGNTYSVNDLDSTFKALKDALIASLDEKSMAIEKEKVEINNEEINVNKISYKFDKESTKKLFSSMAKFILEDEELIANISKITKIEKDKLTEKLNELLDDKFYDNFTNEDNMDFSIYTTGLAYKFVKAEIVEEDIKIELIDYKDTEKITINDFKNSNIYEMNIKTRNEISTIAFTLNKEEIIKFIIKENTQEKTDLEYTIKNNNIKYKGSLIFELHANSDTEASGSVKFTCDMNSGIEHYDLKYDINYKILVGTKIESNKLDKAIDIKDFKEDDTKKLEEALKKIENSNFYKYILNLLGGSSLNFENPTI